MLFWVILILLFCCLLPYAIPVVMPSWWALAICVLLIGGGLAYSWHNEWLVEQDPNFHEGVGGFIGIGMVEMFTGAFAAGAIIRTITLALRRWSARGAIIVNASGLLVLSAAFLYPIVSQAWVMRPVSGECAAAQFSVDISDAHLRTLASPLVTIGSYDLSHPPSLREICRQTNFGEQSVQVPMMELRFEVVLGSRFKDMNCADAAKLLGPNSCLAFGLIQHGHVRETDFPSIARLFAPSEINMRGRGVTAFTANDAANNTTGPFGSYKFFSSNQVTPDGKPLTFACRLNRSVGDEYYCHASYEWHNGAHLDYGYNVPVDHALDKGKRVDATVRSMVDAMLPAN